MTELSAIGIELALVAAGVLFLVYSWYTLREAKKDSDANEKLKVNGARKVMSAVGVDVGWINLICSGLVCLAALGALVWPPPPPNYSQMPQSLLLIVVLILICLLLSLESQIMKTARRRIDAQTPLSHQQTVSISPSPDDAASAQVTAIVSRSQEDHTRTLADVARSTADDARNLADDARNIADASRQAADRRRLTPETVPGDSGVEETAIAAKGVADAAIEAANAAKTVARVARVVADANSEKDKE